LLVKVTKKYFVVKFLSIAVDSSVIAAKKERFYPYIPKDKIRYFIDYLSDIHFGGFALAR
jgi:hypothetical protein